MGARAAVTKMQIALFQPDIPQNTGTILRLCACLDVTAHIIEPAGFPVSDRHFRRAGMDYRDGGADLLLFGRESAGVPEEVVAKADARLVIPIKPGLRSLNVAVAAAMAFGEGPRQNRSATLDAG